jgi:hypothetical protein
VFGAARIERLDGSNAEVDPAFAEGNLAIPFQGLGTIAVLDPTQKKIVWSAIGPWQVMLDARVLPDGKLLVLEFRPEEDRGRVIELDLRSGEITWSWDGGDAPFRGADGGWVARLPNGDTLITLAGDGRAVEVTRDGAVVWEMYNPARSDDRPELVAALCEVQRLPPGAWSGEASPPPPPDAPPAPVSPSLPDGAE